MNAKDILGQLVSFPSVVGTPNGDIVAWVKGYLESHGATVTVLLGPEGDRANLFATIGPKDKPGYILSGHMDVVPASEPTWTSDPFRLRAEGDRLFGRGACDMKGFLAAALAGLPAMTRMPLSRPIHFAFSYDEEAGCRGVPHMLRQIGNLCAPPLGAIIGEPSSMVAIRGHKGKAAARVEIHGTTGHSSRPDRGLNAIHAMTAVMTAAMKTIETLRNGPYDQTFEPPYSTLQIGTIVGGRSVNIIPDLCALELEARAVPGVSPTVLLEPIKAVAEALEKDGFRTTWETSSTYPALSLDADAPLARLMEGLTGASTLAAVSYGTEAGLYQAAGIDAIICGPGDIASAHRADEFIRLDELIACEEMILRLAETLRD
ncbi:acetylornithine deacetylase [Rhizobium ruizarguesonis]|uniref:acetylornithine deacetylase n=2 Tax=Rhizobium ruizarguesonis TaxID=2081791 RepID=UPI00103250EA|nr:acetylornithine deacetylase [Rhizobium ruizarguesonis]NEH28605.1 acetylornithine deacetylase [Rhizobium ruizarguesonis]NEK08443.1 acetylornithine deacetylase [Rhizobium ruizarguesonis]TAW67721.1 acetylornithine deacetylase [Rhizobium ruizarguesonis]TAX03714.1 acetylornithine deacetylase [Rhizobium ruizarguesonis]TAX06691.1 acetylornithine deacetylase [Rhizobium ruizarguesonis]